MASTKGEAWLHAAANRTDLARAESLGTALKIRRLIEAWEYVRTCWTWTPIGRIPMRLQLARATSPYRAQVARERARRRLVLMLFTAGLIQLKPWPLRAGVTTQFRMRVRRVALPDWEAGAKVKLPKGDERPDRVPRREVLWP